MHEAVLEEMESASSEYWQKLEFSTYLRFIDKSADLDHVEVVQAASKRKSLIEITRCSETAEWPCGGIRCNRCTGWSRDTSSGSGRR